MFNMAEQFSYHLKGVLIGDCNCDWGCPCNYEARPTYGFCEGGYVWHIQEGHYRKVPLDGLTFVWLGRAPGAIHEGNITGIAFADERADAGQRTAMEECFIKSDKVMPFAIFNSLQSKFLGLQFVRIDVELNGTHSRVNIHGHYEVELTPMTNPVTGEDEPAKLIKPKGFTSKEQDLCTTKVMRLKSKDLSWDHAGKYGEYSPFEYKG